MRHLHFGKLFFVVFSLLLAYTVSARKPIKTLLITGQNNHNWQVSHVVLKQILENSGRFDVDFAISPEQGKDMSGFVLDFSPYQLVVLDYNGDSWPEETNRRFLEYVQNGGGVVIYHAADNLYISDRLSTCISCRICRCCSRRGRTDLPACLSFGRSSCT